MRGGKAGENRNRQRGVGSVCVGEEILSRRGNQIQRAADAGGAIQKDLFDDALSNFHWKNVNMLQGVMQDGYNLEIELEEQ